jgi:hypothetical protein
MYKMKKEELGCGRGTYKHLAATGLFSDRPLALALRDCV